MTGVFKVLLNIVTIEILYEILIAIMAFVAVYAIKVPVWTRYYSNFDDSIPPSVVLDI